MKKRMPITHVLKIWPQFYELIVGGKKTAELRRNDRDFREGDTIILQEFNPRTRMWTGHEATVEITQMIENFDGLKKGYCVLSVKLTPGSVSRWNTELAGKKETRNGTKRCNRKA